MDQVGGSLVSPRDDLYRLRYSKHLNKPRTAGRGARQVLGELLKKLNLNLQLAGVGIWGWFNGSISIPEKADWRIQLSRHPNLPSRIQQLLGRWISRYCGQARWAAICRKVGQNLHRQGWAPTGAVRDRMFDQIVQLGWELEMEADSPKQNKGTIQTLPQQRWRNKSGTAPQNSEHKVSARREKNERVLLELCTLLADIEPEVELPSYILRNISFLPEALERKKIAQILLTTNDGTTLGNLLTHLRGVAFREIWNALWEQDPQTAAYLLSWADPGQLTEMKIERLAQKLAQNGPTQKLLLRGISKLPTSREVAHA